MRRLRRLFIIGLLVSIAMSLQSQQTGRDSTTTAADSVKVDSVALLKKEVKNVNQSTVEIVKRTEKKIESIPAKIENAVLVAQYKKRMIEVYFATPTKPEPELPTISVDSTIKKKTSHSLFRFLKRN